MSAEQYRDKYERLLKKVSKMRAHQSAYFQYRSSRDLQEAKRLEREVDQMILEETKRKQSGQQEMF
jgi:hypothetical protein